MTFEKVAKILGEYRDIAAEKIKMETTFEELGLDSLDMVELIMIFEEELGVAMEISNDIKTVKDVVDYIDKANQ